jgi:hypothetical protein
MRSSAQLAGAIDSVLNNGVVYDERLIKQALGMALSPADQERVIVLETISGIPQVRPQNILVAVMARLESVCPMPGRYAVPPVITRRSEPTLHQEIMVTSRAAAVAFNPPREDVDPDVYAVNSIDMHRSQLGLDSRIRRCFELAAEERDDPVFIVPFSMHLPQEQQAALRGYVQSDRVVLAPVDDTF